MGVIRKISSLEAYSPVKRENTFNRRLVGKRGSVEHSERMEIIFGEIGSSGSAELHQHPEEQFVYLLQGKMEVVIGEEKSEVFPGEAFYIPSNINHLVNNIGEESLKFILVYSPPLDGKL